MPRHFHNANASTFNPISGQEYTPTPTPKPAQPHVTHTRVFDPQSPQHHKQQRPATAHARTTSSQGVACTLRVDTSEPSHHHNIRASPRVMATLPNGDVQSFGTGYKLASSTLARTSNDATMNLFDPSNPFNTGQALESSECSSPTRRPSTSGRSTFSLFDPAIENTTSPAPAQPRPRTAITQTSTEEKPIFSHPKGRTKHPNTQSTEESLFPRKQKATSSLHQQHPRLSHGNASSVKTSYEWEGHDHQIETTTRGGKRVASEEFTISGTTYNGVIPSGGQLDDPRGQLIYPKSARQKAVGVGINPIPHYQISHLMPPPKMIDRTPQPKIWKI